MFKDFLFLTFKAFLLITVTKVVAVLLVMSGVIVI